MSDERQTGAIAEPEATAEGVYVYCIIESR